MIRPLLRAEWIKFRTVPGWVAGVLVAVFLIMGIGLLASVSVQQSCMQGTVEVFCPSPPTGPGGEAVEDHFSFVHRPLSGDGSLTVEVSGFNGTITYPPPDHDQIVPGLTPWAKAGIMVKAGTNPGSRYAAVMLTAAHGVRMQSDFTHDTAGPQLSGTAWLRLTRTGPLVTGSASADGTTWHTIGAVRLEGPLDIGLFVASPSSITDDASPHGGHVVAARFAQAVAGFSSITPGSAFTYTDVGDDGHRTDWELTHPPGFQQSAGVITVTGSGDIAPAGMDGGLPPERTLSGIYLALLAVVVVAATFGTAEFRTGLIRTTLTAIPSRGRVVVAKGAVIAVVTFVAGLVAAVVTLPFADHVLRSHHVVVLPAPGWTVVRIVAGTALLLGLAGVFAYGIGLVLRRAVAAIVTAAVLLVLPALIAPTSVLPDGVSAWLLRVTPAAALAIQQSIPSYSQVSAPQDVAEGFYPLSPWLGLTVLILWAAAAVAFGTYRLRRADA